MSKKEVSQSLLTIKIVDAIIDVIKMIIDAFLRNTSVKYTRGNFELAYNAA